MNGNLRQLFACSKHAVCVNGFWRRIFEMVHVSGELVDDGASSMEATGFLSVEKPFGGLFVWGLETIRRVCEILSLFFWLRDSGFSDKILNLPDFHINGCF